MGMNLDTVEIPRREARESYLDYRRAAKDARDPVIKRELEEMARAFRIAAQEDRPLIALTPTIRRGGTLVRTRVVGESKTHYSLPRLAVCNADARFAFTMGVERDGSIEFIDSLGRTERYLSGRIRLDAGLDLPDGFRAGDRIGQWTRSAWSAMVPIVPPKHRPAGANLRNLLVLWEADDWTWATVPSPPGDPALLQHVGGDIYAVLAAWDLTPLEQLVLSGRKLAEGIV
jgi:hypothetical protein